MVKLVSMLLFLVSAAPQGPAANFINVDGPDLKSRFASAVKQGAQRQRFWVAYTFPVRPGIAFDTTFVGSNGSTIVVNEARVMNSQFETRNVGIFLLHEAPASTLVRAEIYNLDRSRDYSAYPVYWLGLPSGDDSLTLLRGLLETARSGEVASRIVDAIGAHDEARAPSLLRDVVGTAGTERMRARAVSWLGHWPGQSEFLAALVRDERGVTAIRREAAEALGDSPDRVPLTLLQDLFRAVSHREVKRELLDTISDDRYDGASAFLLEIVERESDRDLRHEAIEGLGDSADRLAFQALEKTAYNAGLAVELQRAAVEAIGERSEGESLALLKKIAKSHPRGEVRDEALERLGDLPDQLPFLVELAADRNESIQFRRNAIEAIGESETGDAIPALIRLFETSNSRELKEEIIDRIADSADRTTAIHFLLAAARNDPDREVRDSAIDALSDLDDESAVDALTQSYDTARDEETKEDILEALAEADSTRALQKLMSVARGDSSLKLRRRAIALIGESDDPAAFQLLEQLVK
jgi:HEAT repeat protein